MHAALQLSLQLYLNMPGAQVVFITAEKIAAANRAMKQLWAAAAARNPQLSHNFTHCKHAGLVACSRSAHWSLFLCNYRAGNEAALAGFCGEKLTFVVHGWEQLSLVAREIIQASLTGQDSQLIRM